MRTTFALDDDLVARAQDLMGLEAEVRFDRGSPRSMKGKRVAARPAKNLRESRAGPPFTALSNRLWTSFQSSLLDMWAVKRIIKPWRIGSQGKPSKTSSCSS